MTRVLPIHPGEHLAEFLEEYKITQGSITVSYWQSCNPMNLQ